MRTTRRTLLAATGLLIAFGGGAQAAEEVNVYTSRHYDTDLSLYEASHEQTGVRVNLIEDDASVLIERIKAEGANSPADVFITVDAGRLHAAVEEGILQPVESEVLAERLPDNLRHPDGLWFALTKRARVIMVRKDADLPEIDDYEDLADPALEGKLCMRSSTNVYNQSLVGSMIAAHGEDAAEEWVEGLVSNFARDPQSNDTGQIKAVAAGECDVTVANTYYLARLATSDDPADLEVVESIRVVIPNQAGRGAHVNVSGIGVVEGAPNRDNAIALIEYLTSEQAQQGFAEGNNEWPAVPGVGHKPVLDELYGEFAEDTVNPAEFGANRDEAIEIMERQGWY